MNEPKKLTSTMVCLSLALSMFGWLGSVDAAESPFSGERGVDLDLACREDIWDRPPKGFLEEFVRVPRDQVVGFACIPTTMAC